MLSDPVKLVAIVGGVILVTWPYLQPMLVKAVKLVRSSFPKMEQASGVDDLSFVLGLAERLRKEGREKASKAAKALLDAMLEVEKP